MATYYVDATDGLDTNNGTSTSTPWQNISKVNSGASAGDTILFKGGVSNTMDAALQLKSTQTIDAYGGGIPILDASADSFVCVQATSTTGATIQNVRLKHKVGSTPTFDNISLVTSCNNLTLRNVHVFGGLNGINMGSISGSGTLVDGCWFERSRIDGFDLRGTFSATVKNSTFERCGAELGGGGDGTGDGVSTHETSLVTISDCLFKGNLHGIGNMTHTAGTVTIDRCLCIMTGEGAAAGGNNCVGHGGVGGTTTVRNCIILMKGTLQERACSIDAAGTLNFINNTVVSPAAGTAAQGPYAFTGTLVVKNNILCLPGAPQIIWDQPGTSITAQDNQYYTTGGNVWVQVFTGYSFAAWKALPAGYDSSSGSGDPLIYNKATPTGAPDVRLLAGSPCIASGTAGLVTVDFHNRTRLTDGDIGATQYHQGYPGA